MKKLSIKQKIISKIAGIGYELYAQGLDRISAQCTQISNAAKKLVELVRENATESKKRKALKELQKWVSVLNGEMRGVVEDVNNLEGYKSNKVSVLKKALNESIINDIINHNDLRKFTMSDAYTNDKDIQKLTSEVYSYFADKLRFNSNEIDAWRRLLNSIGKADSWRPEMQRNNIFKAAHSLGIKLPSAMF